MSIDMKLFQSSNIYETFVPFYFLLKLLGIIPFQLNSRSRKVEVKIGDILWTFMYWIFIIILVTWNIMFGAREPGETSIIVRNAWHYLILFQIISNVFIQFMNFLRRKDYQDFFKFIHDFDELVINHSIVE